MTLKIHQFPCLSDNYGFLIHDTQTGETACIDTPEAEEYLEQAELKGWRITQIWNTHWHRDHAGGNLAIKAQTGAMITAPVGDAGKIEVVDRAVDQGDVVSLGAFEAQVVDVGGHTLGHIAYYLPEAGVAFVGDSLFALGCGRMFEGSAEQFWASLERLKALPAETMMYCAHEYTASNAKFAVFADPANKALADYAQEIKGLRASGEATVPFALGRELACNPFLRAGHADLAERWGSDPVSAFAALRGAKDTF
jgi:hydroxyacylglutathione hydrolase